MAHLSIEAKEAIILKAINRGEATLESVAKSNNIGFSTLQKWLQRYKRSQPISVKSSGKITHSEQFNHILATTKLDDVSLGKYCREHGLYSHQLETWRKEFMKPKQELSSAKEKLELAKLKKENDKLKRELRRKEKALAEASALLIMKKKADLIWGEDEED